MTAGEIVIAALMVFLIFVQRETNKFLLAQTERQIRILDMIRQSLDR